MRADLRFGFVFPLLFRVRIASSVSSSFCLWFEKGFEGGWEDGWKERDGRETRRDKGSDDDETRADLVPLLPLLCFRILFFLRYLISP